MDDLHLTVVDGFRIKDCRLDLSTRHAWSFALDQRSFGPRQLLVVTARPDGRVLSLAHCGLTEPPEMALTCCLDTLSDGAAAAIAYSDEPVGSDPPPGLAERLATARAAAGAYGVHLVDWMLCDDTGIRSMRLTPGEYDEWWDLAANLGLDRPSRRTRSKARPPRPHRPDRRRGGQRNRRSRG